MRRAVGFKRALTSAAACLALAAAGCTTRGNKPTPVSGGDQTRMLYERSCAVCHGLRGEGKQLGTMSVPSLRAEATVAAPDERLFAQIGDGGKGMPPFKQTLDDRQIRDLVRFIREEIQGRK